MGGSATNTAFFLTHLLSPLPVDVLLVGLIGTDAEGQFLRSAITQSGIRSTFVMNWPGDSGKTHITLTTQGERVITRFPSVTSKLAEHLGTPTFQDALRTYQRTHQTSDPPLVYIKAPLAVVQRCAALFPQITAVDVSGFSSDYTNVDFASQFLQLCQNHPIPLLFGNAEEFTAFFSAIAGPSENTCFHPFPPDASVLTRIRASALFCKEGAAGATCITPERIIRESTASICCVDSTGAGDAFNAGVLAALLCRKSFSMALTIGVTLGTAKCAHFGTQIREICDPIHPLLFS